jgi:hypothetical protein
LYSAYFLGTVLAVFHHTKESSSIDLEEILSSFVIVGNHPERKSYIVNSLGF